MTFRLASRVLIAGFAAFGSTPAVAAIVLKYQFRPGAESRYALSVENRTEIRNPVASPQPIVTVMTTAAEMVQRVKAVAGGVATLETRLDRPTVTLLGTQSALKHEFAKLLARTRFNVRVNERGKIHGIDEARGVPAEVKRFVASLGQALAQFQPVFPETGVEIGATWTNTVLAPHALATGDIVTTKIVATFGYVGPKETSGRRGESVSVKMEITMGGNVKQAGRVFSVDVKGTGNGEILWDNDTGSVVTSDISVNLNGAWKSAAMTVEQMSKVTTKLVRQ
ncbi:MAG: hypothetical protein HYY84_06080 [Deltaproteobacteria bacterium]|nr:hypothetical protein [Deltaproteobacteria bacterium]